MGRQWAGARAGIEIECPEEHRHGYENSARPEPEPEPLQTIQMILPF